MDEHAGVPSDLWGHYSIVGYTWPIKIMLSVVRQSCIFYKNYLSYFFCLTTSQYISGD